MEEGFATAIAPEDDDEQMALARSFKALEKLKHVPDALKPKADDGEGTMDCACACQACAANNCMDCDCAGCAVENCGAGACNCGNTAEDSNLSQYEARLKLIRA